MHMDEEPSSGQIEAALKRSAAALRDAGVPFMVGGSLAVWARGGPQSRHDLDLIVRPADAERALETLGEAGFKTERPPEEWLYKAFDEEGTLVDVIFGPTGIPVDDELFGRAEEIELLAMAMPVMSLEDVLATKLLVLDEHSLDYESVLQIARALREKIDWETVERRTAASPFARAFFTLVRELGLVQQAAGDERDDRPLGRARVRVVGGREA